MRLLDETDAPLDSSGKPNWWLLTPRLVFAYLESPPVLLGEDGEGGKWQWPSPASATLRAQFDAARTEGKSVSQAALPYLPEATRAELAQNEATAKQVIASGAFDVAHGLPIDYAHRGELAIRAGLSGADVAALSTAPLRIDPSKLRAFAAPKFKIDPAVLKAAFGTTTPAASVAASAKIPTPLTKALEIGAAIVGGLGVVVGVVLWGSKRR